MFAESLLVFFNNVLKHTWGIFQSLQRFFQRFHQEFLKVAPEISQITNNPFFISFSRDPSKVHEIFFQKQNNFLKFQILVNTLRNPSWISYGRTMLHSWNLCRNSQKNPVCDPFQSCLKNRQTRFLKNPLENFLRICIRNQLRI